MRCSTPASASRARSTRRSTAWSTPRSRTSTARRCILPQATHDAHKAYVESGMLSRRAGLRDRRHAAAVHVETAANSFFAMASRQHRLEHADQRQRQPADGARHDAAEGGVRAERIRRAAGPAPCACRSRRPARSLSRHRDARRARRRRLRERPARPALPPQRQQDVDLGRRARAHREHRPPRAGQDSRRRTASWSRARAASRCSSCRRSWSTPTASSPASATTWRWPA